MILFGLWFPIMSPYPQAKAQQSWLKAFEPLQIFSDNFFCRTKKKQKTHVFDSHRKHTEICLNIKGFSPSLEGVCQLNRALTWNPVSAVWIQLQNMVLVHQQVKWRIIQSRSSLSEKSNHGNTITSLDAAFCFPLMFSTLVMEVWQHTWQQKSKGNRGPAAKP